MEFYDVIRRRRSIRSFRPDPVPDEVIARIAEAVNAAPTACNLQPFVFKFIRNAGSRAAVAGCCRSSFPAEAPLLLAVVCDPEKAWKRGDGFNSVDIDVGIAVEHAVLAAAAEGLGSCWICAFDAARAAQVLNVKAPARVAALCPLGYPAAPPRPFVRKDQSQVIEVLD